jgi:hypothetical protein
MSEMGQKRPFERLPVASVLPPVSRHGKRLLACLKRADTVAKVENRTTPKISRKPMFGRFYCCNARWGRYEGPWSFLCKTMWSLTSPLAERISGPEKFRSSARKDFFNSICQKPTSIDFLGRNSWCCRKVDRGARDANTLTHQAVPHFRSPGESKPRSAHGLAPRAALALRALSGSKYSISGSKYY